MRLIGITGKAGSGKDTVSAHLVDKHHFVRYALAGPIKKAMCAAFSLSEGVFEDREMKEATIDWLGYSPRRLAQLFGTEFGRKIIGDDVWLRVAQRTLDWCVANFSGTFLGVVISDIRYDNEAEWVRKNGGEVWLIDRPGIHPVASHSSEAGVSAALVDRYLPNMGTLDDIKTVVDRLESLVTKSGTHPDWS